jgi:3-isopropylmalate/(R)-2-methylmalate dehydratase small subunit
MTTSSKIERVIGKAVGVRGDDIDTDRIIPARFLKTITFEGLEQHLFEDDRQQLASQGRTHPLDNPAHEGAGILLAQANFGCGSSREHAPQAIIRRGIGAVLAESFAEIFFGNSLMIGLACATVDRASLDKLIDLSEAQPDLTFNLDIASGTVKAGDLTVKVTMPDAVRTALLSGGWDATSQLLDRYEEVERTAARLPYLTGFAAPVAPA